MNQGFDARWEQGWRVLWSGLGVGPFLAASTSIQPPGVRAERETAFEFGRCFVATWVELELNASNH